ncbi:predicted protein [Sclerotinia sclerotiorum 1980 UF-70]|uniref:Uncharacterized protein n=1 Tax=Sclerotinia sclerotiorum (strain ATCC 18683 / 1980 / Ss-1) TaxID=665079 RepID=A7EZ14_SCLS1|nr:predicted protein [Sclerotinia sclerotiorum 1980 UF-70]EDN94706.1 predicted protein [Sclerotinia sclerotiorum 1980 UF-70]
MARYVAINEEDAKIYNTYTIQSYLRDECCLEPCAQVDAVARDTCDLGGFIHPSITKGMKIPFANLKHHGKTRFSKAKALTNIQDLRLPLR